jgi:hypothetical protein
VTTDFANADYSLAIHEKKKVLTPHTLTTHTQLTHFSFFTKIYPANNSWPNTRANSRNNALLQQSSGRNNEEKVSGKIHPEIHPGSPQAATEGQDLAQIICKRTLEKQGQSRRTTCASENVEICNQAELEYQEDRYENKLSVTNLVPEDQHSSIGSKWPKECQQQKS